MNPKLKTIAALLLLAIAGSTLQASAGLPIEIFDTRNSTAIITSKEYSFVISNLSQQQISSLPLSDQLYSWNGALAGEAMATAFNVSAITKPFRNLDSRTYATVARATNETSFQALATSTATLEFEKLMNGGFHLADSQLKVNLINVSSGQVLLNYNWDKGNRNTESATVDFIAGTDYKLSIVAWSIEDNPGPWDQTIASLRVTGFDPISVPEPTTAGILGLGLLTWWSRRRN